MVDIRGLGEVVPSPPQRARCHKAWRIGAHAPILMAMVMLPVASDDDGIRQPMNPGAPLVNTSLTAIAGGHQSAMPGQTVTLDGSVRGDNESTTLAHAWHQISGPRITLSDATAVRPTFAAPSLVTQGTTLIFRLTVVDEMGAIDHDEIRVDVAPSAQLAPEGGHASHILHRRIHIPRKFYGLVNIRSISADGRLVLGTLGPTARIWSTETGELMHVLYLGGSFGVGELSADGRLAITGSVCDVALWDAVSGELLRIWDTSLPYDDTSGIYLDAPGVTGVGLSARGYIARGRSFTCGSGAWLWDVVTGQRLLPVTDARYQDAELVAISTNGKLAFIDADGLRVWDVGTATELRKLNLVGEFTLSADGGVVLAMSRTSRHHGARYAQIVDVTTGKGLCEPRVVHGLFEKASLSTDGGTALTASDDGSVRLWDVASCSGSSALGRHQDIIRNMALSDDGRIALTVSEDGTARLWSKETGALHVLRGHEGAVLNGILSTDGRIAITSGADRTVRVWSVETGKQLRELENSHGGVTVENVALSADGHLALIGTSDLTARLWNADTGELLREFGGHERDDHSEITTVSVAMSADGQRGLTSSGRRALDGEDLDAWLWNTSTGEQLNSIHAAGLSMALNVDGTTMLRGREDGKAELVDTSTNDSLQNLSGDSDAPMVAVALDAQDRHALTASTDGTMRLWNAQTGKLLHTLQAHETRIRGAALSGDGRFAITAGGHDQTARLWDVESGKQLRALAHASNVTDVAISADGSIALTADANGNSWLWDWDAPEGEQLYALRGHEKYITSVALNADGSIALTGSRDGTARLWEITIDR